MRRSRIERDELAVARAVHTSTPSMGSDGEVEEGARAAHLEVCRVAVLPGDAMHGHKGACSILYGACARAARSMGARSIRTYTHLDELGTSLRAAGWVQVRETDGGEWSRDGRQRELAVDAAPKRLWFAPWSERRA